jgi:hypothetical protein
VAIWAPQLYIGVFAQTSTNHSGSPRRPFFKPSSATGSACCQLHHGYSCARFHPGPPGHSFVTSWTGTHAHCHIYLTHVCLCFSRQILFTLGVWLFHVQVLAPTSLHITPSGIFSALACRLSHSIAFTS